MRAGVNGASSSISDCRSSPSRNSIAMYSVPSSAAPKSMICTEFGCESRLAARASR